MSRTILRSSLATAAVIGLFLVSVHLWGVREYKERYVVQPETLVPAADLPSSPERSSVTPATVSVSSNSLAGDGRYAPEYLLEEGRTVWHAEHPPQYPQWVEISFSEPTVISHLAIRTQGDSQGGKEHCRGPKDFVFQATRDPYGGILEKRKWNDLFSVKNNEYSQGEEWKDWFFENRTAYRYYRIYIQAGGDPDYLTIRQLKLDNAVETPKAVEKALQMSAQVSPTQEGFTMIAVPSLSTSQGATQRVVLDPPLKIDRSRVRERYNQTLQRVGVKTKEEAMDFSLDFWENKRNSYSL